MVAYGAMLVVGADAATEVSSARWDAEARFDPDAQCSAGGKAYAKHGCWIDCLDLFDGAHFGLPPAEVEQMDPVQRHLLKLSD